MSDETEQGPVFRSLHWSGAVPDDAFIPTTSPGQPRERPTSQRLTYGHVKRIRQHLSQLQTSLTCEDPVFDRLLAAARGGLEVVDLCVGLLEKAFEGGFWW